MTGYIKSENNAADTLTNIVPEGERRDQLVGQYLDEMKMIGSAY